MAARAMSLVRSSLFKAQSPSSFSSHCFPTFKHGQSSSAPGVWVSARTVAAHGDSASKKDLFSFLTPNVNSLLFPVVEFLHRNASCTPAFRLAIAPTKYESSLGVYRLSQSFRYSSTSGVYTNVNIRFCKQRRNRGEMKGASDNHICFGRYALRALEPAWITSRQILAGQLAMKRNMRGGKSVIRIFPHKPVSLRPAETRMGRGKGSTAFWVAGVRPGRILYEISGVPESIARRAVSVAASKMPVRTEFVKS